MRSLRRRRNLCNRTTMTIRGKMHQLLEVASRLSGLSDHRRRGLLQLDKEKNSSLRKWEVPLKI